MNNISTGPSRGQGNISSTRVEQRILAHNLNSRLQYKQQGNRDCEEGELDVEGGSVASGGYFTPCKGKLLSELLALQSASQQRPNR